VFVEDHAAGEVHVASGQLQSSQGLIVGGDADGNDLFGLLGIELVVLLSVSLLGLLVSLHEVLGEIDPVLCDLLEAGSLLLLLLLVRLGLVDGRDHDLRDDLGVSDLEEGVFVVLELFALGAEVEVLAD